MAALCLPPKIAEKFKQAFVSGEINPEKLMNMSSEERNKFFQKFSDKESATTINSLFESKLLLKNQKQGMVTWAKTVAGLSEPARKDMVSKISRLDQVLNPGEKEAFYRDLAATKLGVGVTRDEATTIARLSQDVEKARAAMESGGDRLAFGTASVKLANYVNELRTQAENFRPSDIYKHPVNVVSHIAGNAKAINASMDDSAIFRQGWKTLWTNPIIWSRNAKKSFGDLARQFGGKDVIDSVNADIASRPNMINGKYIKSKLAVGTLEEAFPTTAPEKIPIFGRAYKASEAAYTAFVHRTRADVFDKYIEIAEKSGINTNDTKELQAIGKLVNSLTGRGSLGKLEPIGNTVNNLFFSPRFLKSNIDMLTLHAGDKMTPFARKQAAVNLVKVISGTAAILTVADAVKPGSVEWDPRSADFGKIRIGDTRFDISAGTGSIVTLAARLATMSSKSSTTGQVNKLNSGKYGAQTGWDVVHNFIDNKLSPAASVVRDIMKGQDQSGNKVTFGGEVKNLFTPLGVKNFQEVKGDPHSANLLITMIADGLGISANTYGNTGRSTWEQSQGKEVGAFKQSVGNQQFKQAAKEYDNRLNSWTLKVVKNPDYQKLPTSQQKDVFNKEKAKLQKDIFKQYNYKYKRTKAPKNQYSNLL